MVNYNYNIDSGFLETFFVEKVIQEEIINFLQSISNRDEYPKDLKMLIDSTKGSLSLHPGELYSILDENIKLFSHYNSLMVAIVLDKPIDTALAVIYTRLIQLERYQFHVFNTVIAATAWLNKKPNESSKYSKPISSFLHKGT